MSEGSGILIDKLKDLENRALVEYVEKRGVPKAVAVRYLQEAYFRNGGKRYFALAFGNDAGGCELRNAYYKGAAKPKGPTTTKGERGEAVNVFEGFMDFLSALVWFGCERPTNDTVVLNSLAHLDKALPTLRQYRAVYAFLDRDEAGRAAFVKLKAACPPAVDRSGLYDGFGDFNGLLIHRTASSTLKTVAS